MKSASRWIVVVIALPVGILLGAFAGSATCVAILQAQRMGHSHNDMFTIALSQLAGAVAGAVLLPVLAWRLGEKRKKRLLEAKRAGNINE